MAGLFPLFLHQAESGNGVFDGLWKELLYYCRNRSLHHDLFKRPGGLPGNAWEEGLSIRELENYGGGCESFYNYPSGWYGCLFYFACKSFWTVPLADNMYMGIYRFSCGRYWKNRNKNSVYNHQRFYCLSIHFYSIFFLLLLFIVYHVRWIYAYPIMMRTNFLPYECGITIIIIPRYNSILTRTLEQTCRK